MKKFFSSKQTSSPERERFFNSLVSIPARIVFSLLLTAVIGLFVVIPGCGSGGDLGEIILGEGFPAAQIWIESAVVGTSTPLTMFGQGSDVDGGALGYEWDFEDDGTFDSTAQNPSTMYAVSGTYTVRLRVTDDEGKSSDATASVLVLGSGSAPAVVVRAWTLHARASGEVTFCAEAEDSLGADVADYAFDFTDDGAFDQSGTSATATNIYTSNDKFTCRVRVTDALGVTSDATVVVVFCTEPYPDYPPSAMIEVPGGTLVTDLTTAIDFKAVGSDIDGGAVASITWDFDGDGFFTDASGREVSATFPEAGQNRVQVRITDNDGTIASIAEVTVVSEAVPGGPGITAHAFADAVHASVGTPINFHCRAENPDGSAVTFSWDFDGDGIVDSTAADAVFAFGLPGIYIPNCRVSDAGGDIATSDLVVIIEDCEGILGPYFWWDCLEEPTIYHGGTKTGRLRVGLGFSLLGGDPQQYQILHKQGGYRCYDVYGELVKVEDHANNVLATNTTRFTDVPTPLVGARPPPFSPIDIFFAGTQHGPPCYYTYTITIKLVDAGIREQVLKCVVTVIHGWIFGDVDANPLGGGDIIFGFQVGLQAAPLNFLPPPPPIFDVEIIYADQTPPWNSVEIDFLGATLPTDWAAENVVDIVGDPIGVRFYTSTNPIEPGAPPLDFQNLFAGTFPDTDMDGDPDLPQELQIQVSNELGEIIGAEVLQIDYP